VIVIAIAVAILIAAYLLLDVNSAGKAQQVQYAVGTSGTPDR
jgi:hypothetical protein